MSNFKEHYSKNVLPELQEKFKYKSVMEAPKIIKIVLNIGAGESVNDKKVMDKIVKELTKIAGQVPVVTKAKKSVAGFKIREGWPIGCKVDLRGERMYHFLERLIVVTIPRIRDFRGYTNKAFDEGFNYNLSLKEQIVFPEIEYDKVDNIRGMNITIVTTAKNKEEAVALLRGFDFPFKEKTS